MLFTPKSPQHWPNVPYPYPLDGSDWLSELLPGAHSFMPGSDSAVTACSLARRWLTTPRGNPKLATMRPCRTCSKHLLTLKNIFFSSQTRLENRVCRAELFVATSLLWLQKGHDSEPETEAGEEREEPAQLADARAREGFPSPWVDLCAWAQRHATSACAAGTVTGRTSHC